VSGTGLGIQGSNVTVTDWTARLCGQNAYVVQFSENVRISNSKFLNTNNGLVDPPWKNQGSIGGYNVVRFVNGLYFVDPDFEAGAKIWSSNNVTVENCESAFNVGTTMWPDYLNTNITFRNNWIHHNRGLDAARFYQGEGIRLELSPSVGGFLVENNRIEFNTGSAVTCTSVNTATIRGNTGLNNYCFTLIRNDDGRGLNSNISVVNNTYNGRLIEVWGSRGDSNRVVSGNILV
jgi:hypothetical protein